ncbi:MAG TPA: methyltransferase domain-containing protein [Spirochaetota bacterium]|nr:methyltransferase domain-containing protein [Spirochaetota bacterium]HSA15321.1 methyltransferase domain-containing protein [Spirochaetota bacterium]
MMTERIKIVKPLYGGNGLGFREGKAVFVRFGVPGEEYSIALTSECKDYDTARIVEINEKSPSRIGPECPNFEACGGCSYLHVSYDFEIAMKQEIIADCLKRIAGMDGEDLPAIQVIKSHRFGYRSHASVKSRNGKAGFFRQDSNELVAFPDGGCLLLSPEINDHLGNSAHPGNEFIIAVGHDGKCLESATDDIEITEKELGIEYRRDIGGFYQANRFLRPAMIESVRGSAQDRVETFMDIFCGIGFFSLQLSSRAARGIGYDIQKNAISYAGKNAGINGIGNLEFHALASSQIRIPARRPELVIIDPPRAGADKKTRRTICGLGPDRIIYVSCNPATFARDIRDFAKAGYRLNSLTMIDMFPGTMHIETIGTLNLR